ncbi:hypothetical protein [Phytobacter massiliensis]|uniref:hypothetical protein n=1 Tax=Phytobacter massiliensis TaxID=1485952 RepID=UPI00031C5D99|nr:hypothetical protein [Phytobacter massiliensis]
MDMLFHANLCQNLMLNNPNMTKDIAKKIKTKDYDFLGILDEGTTKERKENREKSSKATEKENNQNFFASRYKQLKDKKDGK